MTVAVTASAVTAFLLTAFRAQAVAAGFMSCTTMGIDGGPLQILDFQTSDAVLTSTAVRTVSLQRLPAGPHRLRVYPLDPGFILDRTDVRLDGAPDCYGACCHTAAH